MKGRCAHRFLVVDEFIEPSGAFVSCLTCSRGMELSSSSLDAFRPFQHTSPEGPEKDQVLLVHEAVFP
jgi:hypothetical protein